jgi:hypothetical protein
MDQDGDIEEDGGLQYEPDDTTTPAVAKKKKKKKAKKQKKGQGDEFATAANPSVADEGEGSEGNQYVRVGLYESDGRKPYKVLYARGYISAGTRIITEEPVSASGVDVDSISQAYLNLPPRQQATYMRLRPGLTETLFSGHIDRLIRYRENHCGKDRSDQNRERGQKLDVLIEDLTWKWRLATRFHHNRFWVYTNNLELSLHYLYLLSALLVHSCTPNCFAHFNPLTSRLTVHATCDLQPGELLSITKTGDQIWYETANHRGIHWKDEEDAQPLCHSLSCKSAPRAERDRKETLRRELYGKTKVLKAFLAALDEKANPAKYDGVYHENRGRMEKKASKGPDSQDQLELHRKMALEVLKGLSDLGCQDMELVRWRQVLFAIILPHMKGKEEQTLEQAKAAVECVKKCIGTDHPDYEPMAEALKVAEHKVEAKREIKAKKLRESITNGAAPMIDLSPDC